MQPKKSIIQIFLLMTLAACTGNNQLAGDNRTREETVTALTNAEAQATIDQWVKLWGTYDLNLLPEIFLTTDELTYFSSEKEGLIKGYAQMLPHHAGFGFVAGGKQPRINLWLEDIETRLYGQTAVVAAVWYNTGYGEPREKARAQRGPVTFVLVRDDAGRVKIAHAHFANY